MCIRDRANTIFVYYQGKEKDFEQAFGYAMYNKNGDLNYNLLIADVYSSMDNRKNGVYNKYDDYNQDKDGEYDTYNPCLLYTSRCVYETV